MEKFFIDERFTRVRSKNSSREALEQWRNLCSIVKNPKRRFRFTANLSKRDEADAMRRTNQVFLSCMNRSCMYGPLLETTGQIQDASSYLN